MAMSMTLLHMPSMTPSFSKSLVRLMCAVTCQKINSPKNFYSGSTHAQIQLRASLLEFFFYSLKASMFLCSLQIAVFDKIHMHAASLPPTFSMSCITWKSLSTIVMAYEN